MNNLQTAMTVIGAVLIVATLVFGLDSCDDRQQAFKRACVSSGGSLIAMGGGSSTCIGRGAVASNQQ